MAIELPRGLSPTREALANGAVLLVQQTSMAPAVTIECTFDAGSLCDPAGLPGVSQLVGRVIDETAIVLYSPREIARQLRASQR